jgi:hypothetical protein
VGKDDGDRREIVENQKPPLCKSKVSEFGTQGV